MKKKINNRKVIGTIIGLIIFISCAFYFTYAFYQWKSGNSDVNLTIKDSTEGGECSNGPNVDVSNIGPVLNVRDGVKANFSVKNKSSSSISLTLGLQITSISNPLRVESFKYALYQDTTGNDTFDYSTNPILSGNFSKMSVGDNTLSTTLTVDKESTYSFQFIVYIDGNMENASSMMNSSLSASITYGDCTNSYTYLASVEPGSYVKYTGNNGCTGKSCEGQNANYVSDSNMGYCQNSDYKYNANGWRVAYVKDGSAYLTSAGSPECMCTNNDGTSGTSCNVKQTGEVSKHIANLNKKALTYCNSTYAYGEKCDSNSAWNMADADFQTITGDSLSTAYGKSYYNNYSIINNGGLYWFGTPDRSESARAFLWDSRYRFVNHNLSIYPYGLRPVLRLASSVIVTGGTGTYGDPYTITKKITKLSEAVEGSYVKYTGNNGCTGKACEGQNANYVSDTDMGYCFNFDYKYNANGWRVAYVKDGTAYLTSAGSPECMCTNSNGVAGTSCGGSYETTGGLPKHLANLNAKALTYCNSTYAYGGKCDSASAWNMADADFQTITSDTLNTANNQSGGYYDSYSIINNGGFYWFATYNADSSTYAFNWSSSYRSVGSNSSYYAIGLRPVLRLASSVIVTGGTGTYEDPYTITNKITKLSEAGEGSYVKYTGNNGCTGKACEGQNANYVSDTDMGYCVDSNYKYNANGWRVAYVKDGTAYLTSAGSPECMCTNSSGTASTSCSSSESTDGLPKHIANLNTKALTYCNSSYAYGGKCDSNSAWNMADADFRVITGDSLSTAYGKSNYDSYSIINNGGFYWFAIPYTPSSTYAFFWSSDYRHVDSNRSRYANGLRPVLRLQSSVVVTGGSGTYQDPYIIGNG